MTVVLIVEDETGGAREMQRALESAGYEVLPPARNARAALEAANRARPDVVLVDIGGATEDAGNGADLALTFSHELQIPVVYVSARADGETLARAKKADPCAYVLKPYTDRQLVTSIEIALHREKRSASLRSRHEAAHQALEKIADVLADTGFASPASASTIDRSATPELAQLSDREWEVLRALLSNRRVPSIARSLEISPSTVRNHLKSIFAKVGVHSQEELIDKLLHERAGSQ